jgi:hypothetical protein
VLETFHQREPRGPPFEKSWLSGSLVGGFNPLTTDRDARGESYLLLHPRANASVRSVTEMV